MNSPLSHGFLKTPDDHDLYYAQYGNMQAPAVVVLHGGPGSSCYPGMLDWFDLTRWRVVLFDQRGCGKSRPTGSLQHNTTAHLVEDIERLRQHLAISEWVVLGGSWGAFLALAYAAQHAHVIRHLLLRGVFLPSRLQLQWFFQDLRALVPHAWQRLTDTMKPAEKEAVFGTLADRLLGSDQDGQRDAAQRWGQYEDSIMTAMTQRNDQADRRAPKDSEKQQSHEEQTQAMMRRIHKFRIQAHYLQHRAFVELPSFLSRLEQLDTPVTLVHGTHDWICPAANVHLLVPYLRQVDMRWVPGGTHTPADPLLLAGLRQALVDISSSPE